MLTPAFSPETTSYSATTTNASNKITATAAHAKAVISITVNDEPHENGTPATWEEGENEVVITVKRGTTTMTYEVTVTKSGE